jgi:hypothetical protein
VIEFQTDQHTEARVTLANTGADERRSLSATSE